MCVLYCISVGDGEMDKTSVNQVKSPKRSWDMGYLGEILI